MLSITERAAEAAAARSAAASTECKEFFAYNGPPIPASIRIFLENPPLLKEESKEHYYDLFGALVVELIPNDHVEWLWLLHYLNCVWEIFRWRGYIAILINLQRKRALEAVIRKTVPIDREYTRSGLAQTEALWAADAAHFTKHGIDPMSVPAMATVQLEDSLAALNKMLQQAERRCDSIMQQLEYRREVFAHRARRVAEEFLKANNEPIPGLAAADPAPAMAPVDQATPDSIAAGDAPVITEPSATDVGSPSLEETSVETSETGALPPTDQATENQVGDEVATVPTEPAAAADRVSSEEASA